MFIINYRSQICDLRKLVFIFLLWGIFFPNFLQAKEKNCSADATTQLEMNQCACDEYKKMDDELNRDYQALLKQYKKDKLAIERIKSAQESWLKFLDRHLESIYPPGGFDGSVQTSCVCNVKTSLTQQRVTQLKEMLTPEEGDLCGAQMTNE
jgi:uncharacterized protein YecT (DUF1311 family)